MLDPSEHAHPRRPWGATGRRGVYRTPAGRYEARVRTGGVLWHLGTFATEAAAGVALERETKGRA